METEEAEQSRTSNSPAMKTEAKCFDIYRLPLRPTVSRMALDGDQLENEANRGGERLVLVGYIFWREANDNGCGNDFSRRNTRGNRTIQFPLTDDGAAPDPPPLIVKNIGPAGYPGPAFTSPTTR